MRLTYTSCLAADSATVWRAVACMRGVNDELRPLVRMTDPSRGDRLEAAKLEHLDGLRSWLLLFGVVPIDRHRFGFDGVVDGESFAERSESVVNRSWQHRRSVTHGDQPGTSVVRDDLVVEPRLGFLAPLSRVSADAVFRHRHRRLRRRFGEVPAAATDTPAT